MAVIPASALLPGEREVLLIDPAGIAAALFAFADVMGAARDFEDVREAAAELGSAIFAGGLATVFVPEAVV